MKRNFYCRTHHRRHSTHALMHCTKGLKPGECKKGETCPVWAWMRRVG